MDEASKNDGKLDVMLINIAYERVNKDSSYLDQFLSIPERVVPF
jgi:hypothetical protein